MKKDNLIQNNKQNIPNEIMVMNQLFENSIKDIAVIDNNSIFLYANESYLNRTGYTKVELLGKKASILKSGFHDKEFYDDLWKTLNSNKNFTAIFTNKNKNGSLYYEEQTIITIAESGESQSFLVIGVDSCDTITSELNSLCNEN